MTSPQALANLGIDPLPPANSSYEIQPLNYLFAVSVEAGQDSIGGRPSIAFDGTNFLTVWKDPRNSNTSSTDVYGTFIARDGTVLNPSGLAIGTAADTDYVPSVIFDGTNYVVTWVSGGGVTDIYAARVAPNGTVLDTPAVRITDGADPKFRPISLAFDGTNYLIVWRSSSDEIRGTRVSQSLVNLDGPTGFGIGGGFYPWVAFNGTDYLVVWHGHGANGLDIFGALVGKDGAVLSPGVITISTDLNDQDHASVASDGTGFLVAWHDWSGADDFQNGQAHAARVSGAGVVLDNPTIKVSDHTLWQVPVQTVYDGSNYFVAWHVDSEANFRLSDVVGRRVSSAGAVLDQQTIPLAVSYGHQFGPVMGYGDGRYLVEWNAGECDVFSGTSCIRAQMLQKVNTQSATNRVNLTSRQLPTSNRNFSSTSSNPWIAEQSNTGNWLNNIWAFDESHAYVATEADDGTLLGYDGNAWATVAHAQSARKFGLWGTGPSEIWTVGWCWDIVRYDGTTTEHVGCLATIGMGVWASSKLNIMTVGVKGRFFHYEGTDFASQPNLDRGNWRDKPTGVPVDLWDIWGTAANNVYAVGEFGTVIKYDGSNWTRQNNIPTGQSLNAIWGSSANDIFAVGDSGAIIHYNGTSWMTHATPTFENLYGVWGWSGSSVYAVGAYGTILHYDGTDWALEASGTNVVLSDVGGAANTVRAVGANGVILKKAEKDCVGSLAPSSNSFPGSGGSGIVNVTASGGCNWTAIGNDSWITVTSGASGAGDGAVTYSVSPNLEIGSRTGTITIAGQAFAVNQSPASNLTFAIDDVTHNEGNAGTTSYTFTVTKGGSTALSSSVNFTTVDGTATTANNDYQLNAGSLNFLPTDTAKQITVLVISDTTVEPNEAFTVHLSGASGATISNADGTGTITNDDVAPPTLGNYPDTTVQAGADTTVTPDAAPTGATSMNVSTASAFRGTFAASPATGVVQVTNAQPAGTYTVTVMAFNSGGVTTAKTFTLTVTNPTLCGLLSFSGANGSPFAAGTNPLSVAVGDFNGDGKQDLTTANQGSNNVMVLLGDGSGGFSPASGSPFGGDTHPFSVAVGDFNGDGIQDLASSNQENNVTLLLGNGSGGFSEASSSPFAVGVGPFSVAVGDFNGDGKQDLTTANQGSNNVTVLLGNGSGGLSPASGSPFAAGTNPRWVAVGDFNGDGKLDLATANQDSHNVTVLLGNGSGGFSESSGSPFAVGITPRFVAVGDFNGDGKQDLTTANQGSNSVTVLLGDGSGGFSPATGSPFAVGASPVSVAVGDFNGDGKQDLTTSNSDHVTVLLGDGSGSFSEASGSPFLVGFGTNPHSVAVGDFNSDGKQDLTTANYASNNVTVLLNTCTLNTAATITVTNTNDSGAGSLRDAINQANSDRAPTEITFNAGLAGQTIQLQSALPPLTENGTTINGDVNGGCHPDIELDGQLVNDDGIKVFSSNNVIRGLIINRFGQAGVNISGGQNNHVECNYIGADAAGTQNRGNGGSGVFVNWGASDNQVGPGNIIAFNTTGGGWGGVTVFDGANGFAYPSFTGLTPDHTGRFPVINFPTTRGAFRSADGITPIDGSGHPFADTFGARFTGSLTVGATGSYTFTISNPDDQVQVMVDSVAILQGSCCSSSQTTIPVSAGGHTIEVDYFDGPGAAGFRLDITGVGSVALTTGGQPGLFGEFFQLRIPSERNRITQNSIFGNNRLGIELDALEDNFGVNPNDAGDGDLGPNTALNFPEFTTVTDNGGGSYSVGGTAPPNSTVELFASAGDPSGHGEGKVFLASATAAAGGAFASTINVPTGYTEITATATDGNGNTSEFSANRSLVPSLSINDITVTEGDSGTVQAIFTVTLLNPSGTVTVDYSTANNSAIAGSDYIAAAGTLTLSSVTPTQTISIAVNGDTVGEADERFFVNLANPSGAVFADNQGQCIITNDDPAPIISINDASGPEGNSGTRSLLFTVAMTGATNQNVTVDYNLVDQSATAGSDYVGASGTITLFAGETTHTLAVTLNGDTNVEGNETFRVDLSNPTNATLADNQGIGTIIDDEGVTEPSLNTIWQKAQEGMTNIFGATTNGSIYVLVGNSGDIWTSPGSINWTKRTNPDTTNRDLRGVTFGGGQFVAVGSLAAADGGSLILTSPDGITWTQRSTVPVARNLTGVIYGNGLYVATTPGGSFVLTSPDAITWTQRSMGIGQRLNAIAFGGGQFVAVGNERTVFTSSDGINWTMRGGIPTTIGRTLNGVTYDGSKFIVVSSDPSFALNSGSVMTSPDGITWTQQTVPVNQPLLGVTASGGLIVAVGSGNIITSPDGINWTSRAITEPGAGVSRSMRVVTYGPAGFLTAGSRGSIFTSPDGITNWVSQTLTPSRTWRSVVHNGTAYCAVGDNGVASTSPDGVTWSQQITPDPTAYYFWWSVTYGNGLFVASGVSDSIMTSPDGVNWTVRNPATPLVPLAASTSNLSDITYGNGLFVAVGEAYLAPGQTIAHVITSPDGITWTTHDPGLPQTIQGYNWIAVAYGNGKFVVALTEVFSGEFFLLTSPDGQNWTRQPSPLFDPYETFLDIVYANGQFVAVGDRIWTSPDGINWTLRFDYSNTYFNGVAYANNRYVTVGFLGSIYASTDGINWSPQVGATSHTQNAVTANLGGTQFVSLGESAIEYANFTPTISINDVTLTEGNGGTTAFIFTVTKTGSTALNAVVNFDTVNGTATTADNDYQAQSGTLTFLPADITKTITVLVNGDTTFELDEAFTMHLSAASGATIADADGTATLTNDDSAPTFAIDDVTNNEGNVGTTSYTFTVTKTGSTPLSSSVNFTTVDGSASVNFTTVDGSATTANNDYQLTSGTLNFLPTDTTKQITVLVTCDTTVESDETFFVNLSSPVNASLADSQGAGSITNDDVAPPTLGNYPDTTVPLGANTTVTPDAAPTNTTSINASTTSAFTGAFAANTTTGVVQVTNAQPAGTYIVTVTAFNSAGVPATKTFTLTVNDCPSPINISPASLPAGTIGAAYSQIITASAGVQPYTFSIAVAALPQVLTLATGGALTGTPTMAGSFTFTLKATDANGCTAVRVYTISIAAPLPCTAASFSGPTHFGTGAEPLSVASGDFNGDNHLDLVTANVNSNTLSILLGDGAGGFSGPLSITVLSGPYAVAVGDFNADNKLDIVVAKIQAGTVALLLGNGTGGFGAPTDIAAVPSPRFVAVADFSGDGKLDLAVANGGSANVTILLGNGAGGFNPPTDYVVGDAQNAIALGDFNGDGRIDLACAGASANVFILLGNGIGGFGSPASFAVTSQPLAVATADFNLDNKLDLVTADYNTNKLSILLGNGTGGFGAATSIDAGVRPRSITVGDFNNDGRADLAAANEGSNNVAVHLGNGAGGFSAGSGFNLGAIPLYVIAGRFNADSRLDLVATMHTSGAAVLLNDCCGHALSPASAFFPVAGSEASFDLITTPGCSWSATSNDSWIELSSEASGSGSATLSYVVRDNFSPIPRVGTITVAGLTFHITQDSETAPDCTYNIFPPFESHPAAGGSGSINVVTDERCAWQAVSNAGWITVTSNCCAIGSGSVSYSVAANPDPSGRAGTITIGGKAFNVKQKGN